MKHLLHPMHRCQEQIHDLIIIRHVPCANDPGKNEIFMITEKTQSLKKMSSVNFPNTS